MVILRVYTMPTIMPDNHAANAPGLLQAFDRGYYAIERNANPKILFLDLSFRVSKLLQIPKTESAATIH